MFALTQDRERLLDAEQYIQTAVAFSPKRQQLLYMFSTVELQLGKIDEGVALIERSIDDNPKIGEGWWRLALTYKEIGQAQKAIETAQEAIELGIAFDEQGQKIISQILSLGNEGGTGTAQ